MSGRKISRHAGSGLTDGRSGFSLTWGRRFDSAHADRHTLVELCVVIVVIGILMATAAALLMRARMAGIEASVRGTLRSIHTGQIGYAGACGSGSFASSLVLLAAGPPGSTHGYMPAELGGGAIVERSGYRFTIQ